MPKIYTLDSRISSSGMIKEMPNTSILLGGLLVDKQTLQPKFPVGGDENNAPVRDWYNYNATGTNNTPYWLLTSRNSFNTPFLSCYYYLSGYWRCNNVVTDSTNGRTYYLQHGSTGPQSANNQGNYNPSIAYGFNLNSTGQWGGWGMIRDFTRGGSGSTGYYSGYNFWQPDWAVHAYDNNTEAYLFTNRYPNYTANYGFAGGDQGNTGAWNSYTHVVGIAKIDPAGNRYYWRMRTNWNALGGDAYSNPASQYGNYLVAGINRDYQNGYTQFMTETNNAASNSYGTMYGVSIAAVYRHFILATANYVYFLEFVLSNSTSAGMHYPSTSTIHYLKKVTFSGTETTIGSYGAWMYGAKLPTQVFNETATAASFIYHTWGQWTGTAHAAALYRCDVNKTLGTETVTALTLDSNSNTAFTRMYNLFGIQTTSVPVGVYNDQYWRSNTILRSWLVTGATGTIYLMISFEHPMTNFATPNATRNNIAQNAVGSSIQQGYFNTTTHTNDNGSGFLRRDAFRIWSFTLDGTYTNATYRAETDFTNLLPRWMIPVDGGNGLIQYMAIAGDQVYDKIIQFDEVSYKWAVTNTMPYRCDSMGLDSIGRLWISVNQAPAYTTDTLFLEGLYIPYAINVNTYASSYTYLGANISSNISVSTQNFAGNLIAANVGLTLSGNITFQDGSVYKVITTSSSAPIVSNITITGSTAARFYANIVNLI